VALGLALLIGAREGQQASPEVEPDAEGPGLDRPEDEAAP
jgi:hypothetical protein